MKLTAIIFITSNTTLHVNRILPVIMSRKIDSSGFYNKIFCFN